MRRPSTSNSHQIHIPLYEEDLLLSVPADRPAAGHAVPRPGEKYPGLDLRLVEDNYFILLKPGQRTRQISDRLLTGAGVSTRRRTA